MLRAALCKTVAIAALMAAPGLARGGEAWDDIRSILFDEQPVVAATAADGITLNAPYRSSDDLRTALGARISLPGGALIDKVYLVVDENPMPVSAVFDMAQPVSDFAFETTMRLNGSTGVHLVVQTDSGALYVSEGYVKTSGVGACAAPPGTDPVLALETLGQMELALSSAAPSVTTRLAALKGDSIAAPAPAQIATINFRHPSHSGLQKDQITLLYLPARFIETVEVSTDGQPAFTMTGSISLSEDPALSVHLPAGAATLQVQMTDTEGAQFEQSFSLGQS